MALTDVTDATFEEEVLKSAETVVVDFWAEWCGPCKMITPALEELSSELQGQVAIKKVNIDDNPGVAMKYAVRSIPMLMVFKQGEVVNQHLGAAPKGKIGDWIKSSL